MNILITKQIGGGAQWVELVLVGRLGGLFGGRRFCNEDSFAGHSGLCCGNCSR